ncbi:MAG: MotA/TolQ/ExbB proton channel family protein [Myxococcota bacterium]|jgi:biopolymer transport protein ExbB|nr:MotA/TolQ/ExbB proton channel family protein [Myxococcota bacterium]
MHDLVPLTQLMGDGGPMMWPLLMLSLLIWYLLGKRFFVLQTCSAEKLQKTAQAHLATMPHKEKRLQILSWQQNNKLKSGRITITTLINIAPLLGLLGTVGGMVNCFAALSGTITIAQTSVAVGISEALLSTQLGLLVAIPALCSNLLLNRKEEVLCVTIEETLNALLPQSEAS